MDYKIGVIAGDGIGPEVMAEALKVLRVVSKKDNFNIDLTEYPWGSNRYLQTGEACPPDIINEYKKLDAILFGAMGDPRCPIGVVEKSVLLNLRVGLDLYVNLRPIELMNTSLCPLKNKKIEDVDFVVCRENTEDAYTSPSGFFKKDTADEIAMATMMYSRNGIERIIRYAFETCVKRNNKMKVTLVDKANAIPIQQLWRKIFNEIGNEYPNVTRQTIYVDRACMMMVETPEEFDVIVTTNLFGDIITDLGASIQGGMGFAASGNINPGKVSMFEPIHGSAPDIAGKNIANPIAAILSVNMMLTYLGEHNSANRIKNAVQSFLKNNTDQTNLISKKFSTSQIGDKICELL